MARPIKNLGWFDRQYRANGYTTEMGGSGHLKVYDPEGRYSGVSLSLSCGDHRWQKNAEKTMRNYDTVTRQERNAQAIARVHDAAQKKGGAK